MSRAINIYVTGDVKCTDREILVPENYAIIRKCFMLTIVVYSWNVLSEARPADFSWYIYRVLIKFHTNTIQLNYKGFKKNFRNRIGMFFYFTVMIN